MSERSSHAGFASEPRPSEEPIVNPPPTHPPDETPPEPEEEDEPAPARPAA